MQISEHRCAVVPQGILRPKVLLILGITVNALCSLNFCKIHCADFLAPAICKPQSGMKEALPLRIANMKGTNPTKPELPQTLPLTRTRVK